MMAATFDSDHEQEDTLKARAKASWEKIWARLEELKKQAAESKASATTPGHALLAGFSSGPSFSENPFTKAPETPTKSAAEYADLYRRIAEALGQEKVDDAAFLNVRDFTITRNDPLVLRDPESHYETLVNSDEDGNHVIAGLSPITAAYAVTQVKNAMLSDLIRAQGGYIIEGTEKDHALQILAARDAGMKINDPPTISPAVMTEALMEWHKYKAAKAAPDLKSKFTKDAATPPKGTATPAVDEVVKPTALPDPLMLRFTPSTDSEDLAASVARAHDIAREVPAGTTVGLEGTARDRIILYTASLKLGLTVDDRYVPTADDARASGLTGDELVAAFDAYDQRCEDNPTNFKIVPDTATSLEKPVRKAQALLPAPSGP